MQMQSLDSPADVAVEIDAVVQRIDRALSHGCSGEDMLGLFGAGAKFQQ